MIYLWCHVMALLNLSVFQRKLQSQKCDTYTFLTMNAKPNAILETIRYVLCSTYIPHCLRFLARAESLLYCCIIFLFVNNQGYLWTLMQPWYISANNVHTSLTETYSSFYYMSIQISSWKTVVVDFIRWYIHTNLVFDSMQCIDVMCYNSAYMC